MRPKETDGLIFLVVLGWVLGIAENPTISDWSNATQRVGGSEEKKSNPGSRSFEQTTR